MSTPQNPTPQDARNAALRTAAPARPALVGSMAAVSTPTNRAATPKASPFRPKMFARAASAAPSGASSSLPNGSSASSATPAGSAPAGSAPAPAAPGSFRSMTAPTGAGNPVRRIEPVHWVLLGAVVLVTLVLRLRDPLSSQVIGAEDPYRIMNETWNLVQGKATLSYPLGLMIFLAPLTILGHTGFYYVIRFLPPVLGVVMVLGMFNLCRRYMHPAGALTSSLLLAVMPEAIRRTDLMWPTAVDLALLPILFLLVLKASEGRLKLLWGAGAICMVFLLVHPYVFGLLLPPFLVWGAFVVARDHPKYRLAVIGGAAAFAVALVLAFSSLVFGKAIPKLMSVVTNPGSLSPLPRFVDLPSMLTLPALILGAIGLVLAFYRPTRFTMLAALWSLMLLPLIFVDWFNVWYIPHRTVVYFALGLAMLAGLPVSAFAQFISEAKPRAQASTTLGVVGLALLLTVPSGATMPGWYRLYSDHEYDAWHYLDDKNTPYVEAGSWQAQEGYRAVTGRDAVYNPDFFRDTTTRDYELRQHPGLVVLIDNYTAAEKMPTDFLANWQQVGHWGQTSAYTCPTNAC